MASFDDEVICNYTIRTSRLLRKSVRRVAREAEVPEWQVVLLALLNYEPVVSMMGRLLKGEMK